MKRSIVVGVFSLVIALTLTGVVSLFPSGVAYAHVATPPAGELPGPTMSNPVNPAQAATPPAAAFSAVGELRYETRRQVTTGADGEITRIAVQAGDSVKRGDLLALQDATHLDRAVQRAELTLESAQLTLDKLNQEADKSAIALAEADLLSAQENLAVVEAGPTKEELSALQNRVNAAWAAYNEVKQGPTQPQLDQLKANLEKARVDLQQAQRAYDKISWRPDVGASDEAAALQRATIDFQAAQGAFDEATTISKSALASALSNAQEAQNALNALQAKPTPAELASAKAAVAAAEAALARAQKSSAADLRLAEISVEQATLDLAEARAARDSARVTAPTDGIVLEVMAEPGAFVGAGSPVVAMADAGAFKLIVNVEQKDISRVRKGQSTTISVFALPDASLAGVVEKIGPVGAANGGVITFPVTIRLKGDSPGGLRSGMTAAVAFIEK